MEIIHEVTLSQYAAKSVGGALKLGTRDSYGAEKIHVTRDETWAGLTITATFRIGGTAVRTPLDGQDRMDVPQEATSEAGRGTIVFVGTDGEQQIITKNLNYSVDDHDDAGGDAPNPTPDVWTQFVAQTKDNADRAELSADSANAAAAAAGQDADSAQRDARTAQQQAAARGRTGGPGAAGGRPGTDGPNGGAGSGGAGRKQRGSRGGKRRTGRRTPHRCGSCRTGGGGQCGGSREFRDRRRRVCSRCGVECIRRRAGCGKCSAKRGEYRRQRGSCKFECGRRRRQQGSRCDQRGTRRGKRQNIRKLGGGRNWHPGRRRYQ